VVDRDGDNGIAVIRRSLYRLPCHFTLPIRQRRFSILVRRSNDPSLWHPRSLGCHTRASIQGNKPLRRTHKIRVGSSGICASLSPKVPLYENQKETDPRWVRNFF
jgi:hypothetical protein